MSADVTVIPMTVRSITTWGIGQATGGSIELSVAGSSGVDAKMPVTADEARSLSAGDSVELVLRRVDQPACAVAAGTPEPGAPTTRAEAIEAAVAVLRSAAPINATEAAKLADAWMALANWLLPAGAQ